MQNKSNTTSKPVQAALQEPTKDKRAMKAQESANAAYGSHKK